MLTVYVDGVGIQGPGLDDWERSRAILVGRAPHVGDSTVQPQPRLLAPPERRRASFTVRLAVHVAQEALERSGFPGEVLATVFASSEGDTAILHQLCSALARPEKVISPTSFHNSVHNAPAGYWSIAAGSHASSNSLSGYDATFAVGLLDSACQVVVEDCPVLLSAYDMMMPDPLSQARPLEASFAAALVLLPRHSRRSLARLDIDLERSDNAAESTLEDPRLELLRRSNPAARALPLLAAIARGQATAVVLKSSDGGHVRVKVAP